MQSESLTERAIRRRNALLALLHRGPQRYEDLIEAIDRDRLFVYDHAQDPTTIALQQRYQFRRDLQALRLHYSIEFDQKSRHYVLLETPFGVALSPKQLAAFALVLDTFQKFTLPQAHDVQELLAFLLSRLPEDQQRAVVEQKRALNIEIPEKTDYSQFDTLALTEIEKAILRGQQLEFTYRSPREGKEVHHVIEPQKVPYKDGHFYLHGWSIDYQKELRFRLDYILPGTAHMLRKKVASIRPSRRTYPLRYHLTPVIARNSVSKQFLNQQVERHPDGSATINATIDDLFDTRQTMLKYAENCIVESPPELVEQMQLVATHFAQVYLTPEG